MYSRKDKEELAGMFSNQGLSEPLLPNDNEEAVGRLDHKYGDRKYGDIELSDTRDTKKHTNETNVPIAIVSDEEEIHHQPNTGYGLKEKQQEIEMAISIIQSAHRKNKGTSYAMRFMMISIMVVSTWHIIKTFARRSEYKSELSETNYNAICTSNFTAGPHYNISYPCQSRLKEGYHECSDTNGDLEKIACENRRGYLTNITDSCSSLINDYCNSYLFGAHFDDDILLTLGAGVFYPICLLCMNYFVKSSVSCLSGNNHEKLIATAEKHHIEHNKYQIRKNDPDSLNDLLENFEEHLRDVNKKINFMKKQRLAFVMGDINPASSVSLLFNAKDSSEKKLALIIFDMAGISYRPFKIGVENDNEVPNDNKSPATTALKTHAVIHHAPPVCASGIAMFSQDHSFGNPVVIVSEKSIHEEIQNFVDELRQAKDQDAKLMNDPKKETIANILSSNDNCTLTSLRHKVGKAIRMLTYNILPTDREAGYCKELKNFDSKLAKLIEKEPEANTVPFPNVNMNDRWG